MAVVLTGFLLLGLLLTAQPTSGVLSTVSGPDEVSTTERFTYVTTVDVRQDERIPVRHFALVVETEGGDSVTVTFDQNGTVLDVEPERGVLGEGEIRITLLTRTLEIVPVERNVDFGPGSLFGVDERTGIGHDFGYGYGYGYGYGDSDPSFVFLIGLDARAFERGRYSLHVGVVTDGGRQFASNAGEFEVVVPGTRP